MSDLVTSIGYGQFLAAGVVLAFMLIVRGKWAMLVGSIFLMGITLVFLSTSSNLEIILLYGTLPPEAQLGSPSSEVQRARIALWNIVVSLVIGGVGVNVFSSWLSKRME